MFISEESAPACIYGSIAAAAMEYLPVCLSPFSTRSISSLMHPSCLFLFFFLFLSVALRTQRHTVVILRGPCVHGTKKPRPTNWWKENRKKNKFPKTPEVQRMNLSILPTAYNIIPICGKCHRTTRPPPSRETGFVSFLIRRSNFWSHHRTEYKKIAD